MNGNFRVKSEILGQPDVHGRGPVVRAFKEKPVSPGHVLGLEVASVAGRVDRFLGHRAIGRPLAAGDGHQISLRDVHHVVADEALGVRLVRVLDEGSNSGPENWSFKPYSACA